ncbi:MAG: tetratricopeptide repeat protein, partial [Myxococcota bacterium]
ARAAAEPENDEKAFQKHLKKGQQLIEKGNSKAALGELQKALAIKPRSAAALTALGNAHYELEDNGAAVKALKSALSVDPRYAHAYVLLGAVYQSQGKRDDARAAYEKYLSLEPNGRFARDVQIILKSLSR